VINHRIFAAIVVSRSAYVQTPISLLNTISTNFTRKITAHEVEISGL